MTLLFAAISGEALLMIIVTLLVFGVIFGLLWWLVDYCNIPEPWNRVARIVLAIGSVALLINFLLGMIGRAFIVW